MSDYLSLKELEEAHKVAEARYLIAKQTLEKSRNDPVTLHLVAQEANDAWVEFKKAGVNLSNYSTLKKLGDLYGC